MNTPLLVSNATNGVRTLTLHRPHRLNAIDLPMLVELDRALRNAVTDDSVKALVLCGAGRAFCAGDDLDAQAAICNEGEHALRQQLKLLQAISEHLVLGGKPSLVVVRGPAIGAGLSWVLNCDLALWAEDSYGAFPEVSFGTSVTGGATFLLPQAVGRPLSNSLLFGGTTLSAHDAMKWGLAHEVCSGDALTERAELLSNQLAVSPGSALRHIRRVLSESWADDFRRALELEAEACVTTMLDPSTLQSMRRAITSKHTP